MSSNATTPRSRWGHWINEFEETAIAVLLGLMTLITFANVVLRYGFNTGLIWGLEATTFLFAWLVLFGVSYAVKVTAHLGVDALINIFAPKTRRILTLIAAAVCVVYAGLRWIQPIMNDGDDYEKIPRFIPYAILPIGMALLLFRFVQVFVRLLRGREASLIVSHEVEEAVAEVKHLNAKD